MIPTLIFAFASLASAHTGAFGPGMYCRGGIDGNNNNANDVVNPLTDLPKSQWWFQHDRGCDARPPPEGEFLELPAGGEFTVELAHNQGQTTLSFEGRYVSDWPDGLIHPEDYKEETPGKCLSDGALHTNNQSMAAGTAWAISYESDLTKITMESLVVFTVLEHTPWKRLATYQVPKAMPACPPAGCTCAWLWAPNLCGISNIYMQGFKCKVTGATSKTPLALAKPPVFCENEPSKCVSGAKQMIAWKQADGNNIETEWPISPAYSEKCGWKNGAQNDIFAALASSSSSVPRSSSTTTITTVVRTSATTTTSALATTSVKPTTLSTRGSTISNTTTIKTTKKTTTAKTRTRRRATTKTTSTAVKAVVAVEATSTAVAASEIPSCGAPTQRPSRRHLHNEQHRHA